MEKNTKRYAKEIITVVKNFKKLWKKEYNSYTPKDRNTVAKDILKNAMKESAKGLKKKEYLFWEGIMGMPTEGFALKVLDYIEAKSDELEYIVKSSYKETDSPEEIEAALRAIRDK